MKNITYLFGAGASYKACPIWKEQAEKMSSIYKIVESEYPDIKEKEYKYLKTNKEKLLWLIMYFGNKAQEFNTIDTYAKKLYLLNDTYELNRLKAAVSCFFTIWSNYRDFKWSFRLKEEKRINFEPIDHRYINLLATYLEKNSNYPKLKENIKFVTWNYDLQLESAYLKFTNHEKEDFVDINDNFKFNPSLGNISSLDVCHLNGFYGFYGNSKDHNLFKRSDIQHPNINEILSDLDFVIDSIDKERITFKNHINYAWENDSEITTQTRKHAKKIFAQTDILVIIGYSFPPFNYEIDKDLFSSLNANKIIIQDPHADSVFLSETFGISSDIKTVNSNMEQFVIPYYHENEHEFTVRTV